MLKEVIISLDIDENQLEALKELLPHWQQYTSKGEKEKPFADITAEKLLEHLLYRGSKHMIWERIKDEQFRQGIITVDELMDNKEITVAQREKERQQAQKEGDHE